VANLLVYQVCYIADAATSVAADGATTVADEIASTVALTQEPGGMYCTIRFYCNIKQQCESSLMATVPNAVKQSSKVFH